MENNRSAALAYDVALLYGLSMRTAHKMPKYLTTAQVAEMLGYDGSTITRWAKSGKLPAVLQVAGSGVLLFDPDAVAKRRAELAASQRRKPGRARRTA